MRCPRGGPCRGTVALRIVGERRAFVADSFRNRKGALRPRFLLPKRVTNRADSPLPVRVIVKGAVRKEPFRTDWIFDLSEAGTPVSGA